MARLKYPACSLIAVLLVLAMIGHVRGEELTTNVTTDPAKALFVNDDVVNFIRVQKLLQGATDTITVLQKEYLDKGTPGLKRFIERFDLTAERIQRAMRRHPDKYASLAEYPAAIEKLAVDGRAAYARLKEYIPEAVFPPTYFLIGAYRGIGSASIRGILLTVEKWTLPPERETTRLVHELTRFQQMRTLGLETYRALTGSGNTLLGACIREGAAEFFADLVTGHILREEAIGFTRDNEEELWRRFVTEMHGTETGDWMWGTPKDSLQPPNVGYVLGCFIVRSYYVNAEDKDQAVREILGVTDYDAFLAKSRYAMRFEP